MLDHKYKIMHCKEYDAKRNLTREWCEVYCYKKRFFFFTRWWVETERRFDSGGGHNAPIQFKDEQEAFDYIGRVSMGIPKDTVIRKEGCSYI